jgi:hypothetical protein
MKVTVKDGFTLKVNPSHTKLVWLAIKMLEMKEQGLTKLDRPTGRWVEMWDVTDGRPGMWVDILVQDLPQFIGTVTLLISGEFYSLEDWGRHYASHPTRPHHKMYHQLQLRKLSEDEIKNLIPEIRNAVRSKDGFSEISVA